jgi:hypothetical protein
MSFVQRELDRIRNALESHPKRYAELYAAQQALAWALDPDAFNQPFNTILRGNLEDSEDCLERSHPALSSNTRADCVLPQQPRQSSCQPW